MVMLVRLGAYISNNVGYKSFFLFRFGINERYLREAPPVLRDIFHYICDENLCYGNVSRGWIQYEVMRRGFFRTI